MIVFFLVIGIIAFMAGVIIASLATIHKTIFEPLGDRGEDLARNAGKSVRDLLRQSRRR